MTPFDIVFILEFPDIFSLCMNWPWQVAFQERDKEKDRSEGEREEREE